MYTLHYVDDVDADIDDDDDVEYSVLALTVKQRKALDSASLCAMFTLIARSLSLSLCLLAFYGLLGCLDC